MSLDKLKSSFASIKKNYDTTGILELGETTFHVSVLSRTEEIESQEWADTQNADSFAGFLKLDLAKLSYAIRKINHEEIPAQIADDQGFTTPRNIILREFLGELPTPVIDALVYKYNEARAKLREKLGLKEIGLDTLLGNTIEKLSETNEQSADLEESLSRLLDETK